MSRNRSSRPKRSPATVSTLESAPILHTATRARLDEVIAAIAEGLLALALKGENSKPSLADCVKQSVTVSRSSDGT